MAIIDVFTYNGELEMLKLHLAILDEHVKQFIIVESGTTFSGHNKPLYFYRHQDDPDVKKYLHKIKYYVNTGQYTPEEYAMAENSPQTQGAAHWKNEFLQKESIKKALVHLKDKDTVFIGDVDEIWDINAVSEDYPAKLRLKVYAYYLDNRSSEDFAGTLVAKYWQIKDECLNHLRQQTRKSLHTFGWHFTSMGGYDEVRRKLSDSYTEESYWTAGIKDALKDNIERVKDFLGRSFHYFVDEKDWPQYLKDNRDKFKHLCLKH